MWLLIIVLSLLWGSSFLLLKRVLTVYSPIQVFAGRMLFATLVLLPVAIREIRRIPTNKWPPLLAVAIIANFTTTLLNALAQVDLASSLAAMLNTLTPLMTVLVGILFFAQRIPTSQLGGLSLGLIGSIALILSTDSTAFGKVNIAALFIVGSAICQAFTHYIIRFDLDGLRIGQIAAMSFLLISPLALVTGWQSGLFKQMILQPEAPVATVYLAFLGIGANAGALLLLARLIQISSPIVASQTTYLIPLVAIMWGMIDGEQISVWQISIMGVVLTAVWLVNRQVRR